jgi:hypothetical protein
MTPLTLFEIAPPPEPPELTAGGWGVEISEIKVFTYSGSDPEWWAMWRGRMEPIGRITIICSTIPGDVVHVACGSRDDAISLRDAFVEQRRIHKSAIRISQIPTRPLGDNAW